MPTFAAMSWNVANLFRPELGAAQPEQQRYQQKLALLAAVINQVTADVVALQEIGGDDALFDLQQALGGTFPHRVISKYPDARGIRVAFLSKFAIANAADIVEFPPGPALDIRGMSDTGESVPIIRMGRGALLIRVTDGAFMVDVMTDHLKSNLLSFPRPGGETSFTPGRLNRFPHGTGHCELSLYVIPLQ